GRLDRHAVVEHYLHRIPADAGTDIRDFAPHVRVVRSLDIARTVVPAPSVVADRNQHDDQPNHYRDAFQSTHHDRLSDEAVEFGKPGGAADLAGAPAPLG